MVLIEQIHSKVSSLRKYLLNEIQDAQLRERIVMSYHNDIIEKLNALSEVDDEKLLIDKIKDFLDSNWQKIKGSSVSYTALPSHEITKLCCWMAEQVCQYEQEHDEDFKSAPKISLNYLMTDINTSSKTTNFPEMGIIPKTEFSEEKVAKLEFLVKWLEDNGGIPNNEHDLEITEEQFQANEILESLEKKKVKSSEDNSYIERLQREITPEIRARHQKLKKFQEYKAILAIREDAKTQHEFLKEGVYREEESSLVFNMTLQELLETHIENGFNDGLVAIKELGYDMSEWAYESDIHQEKTYRLIQLINLTDGLILKTQQALQATPKDSKEHQNLTQKIVAYQIEAQSLTKELSEAKQKVLSRLLEHSAQTRALIEAKKTLEKLRGDDSHLLGQLLILRKRLKFSDAHGGKGTSADAATDAYNAIIEFNDYYNSLAEEAKKTITEPLRAEIERLIKFGSTKNSYQQGIATCIGMIGVSIEHLISGNEQALTKITNSDEQKETLLQKAREELQNKIDVLIKDVASHQYQGADALPLKKAIIDALKVTITINSPYELEDFMSLSPVDMREILKDEKTQAQLIKFISPNLDSFILMQPIEKLSIIFEAAGKTLIDNYFKENYTYISNDAVMQLYDFIDNKNKQALLVPFLLPYNWLLLQYAHEDLKKDKAFFMGVVKQDWHAIQYAHEDLKKDKAFFMGLVKQDWHAIQYAHEDLKKDKAFFMGVVKQDWHALQYAHEDLKKDKEIILEAVKQDWQYLLLYGHEDLKKDKEIILEAIKQDWYAIQYAHEDLKKDKEIILEAVKQDWQYLLLYGHKDLTKDKEVVMEAVKQNWYAFIQFAHEDFKKDKEVVMEVVKQSGSALEYAHEDLKKDKEVVMEAVKKNWHAIQCAHKDLTKDKEVVMEAVKQDWYAIQYAHKDLKKDKEVVMEAVKQDWHVLQYTHEDLNKDKEVIMEAVKQDWHALQYAHEDLTKDKEVVMEAVKQDWHALQYAHEDLTKDKEIVMEAVKQDWHALQYAHEELTKDKAFIMEVIKKDKYILHNVLSDRDMLKLILPKIERENYKELLNIKNNNGTPLIHAATKHPYSLKFIFAIYPRASRVDLLKIKNQNGQMLQEILEEKPNLKKEIESLLPQSLSVQSRVIRSLKETFQNLRGSNNKPTQEDLSPRPRKP